MHTNTCNVYLYDDGFISLYAVHGLSLFAFPQSSLAPLEFGQLLATIVAAALSGLARQENIAMRRILMNREELLQFVELLATDAMQFRLRRPDYPIGGPSLRGPGGFDALGRVFSGAIRGLSKRKAEAFGFCIVVMLVICESLTVKSDGSLTVENVDRQALFSQAFGRGTNRNWRSNILYAVSSSDAAIVIEQWFSKDLSFLHVT